MIWPAALVLGLAQFGAATLSKRWNDVAVKHSWAEVPRGWEYHSSAPADYKFDMRLALKQHNIDALIANLLETSDPQNSRYGQHLTPTEAEALAAPHPDSREAIEAWLKYHSISPESIAYSTGGGEWVTIRVSVAEAERMLDAKYNVYHHHASSEQVVRTMSYSLPRELNSHVDVITPTTYFGTMRSMRATSFLRPDNENVDMNNLAAVPSSCQHKITISCLRDLYNTTTYTPSATDTNKLGIVGYLQEYANYADLQTFYKSYHTDAVGSNFSTVLVNGGLDDQSKPGVEANLDIQYAAGISFPTPNIYYSTGGSPPFNADSATPSNTNEPYLDWLNYVLSSSSPIPQTISTSYGDDEQTVPEDYARKVCNLLAHLGSIGTTVFFSSGDYGVGSGDCSTNDGTGRKLFQPNFPASCPFVTTVGATTSIPEVATSFSGGGFSRYFPRPKYQNAQVTNYLSRLGSTYSGLYNSTGRAYPDISAQGDNFAVIVSGQVNLVGGTSASAPTVAGIFSLLNDARIAANKTSLGFINPLIYSNPTGFNDIVSGNNPGCNTSGFRATTGWDPVTGLGTPDFLKLKGYLG